MTVQVSRYRNVSIYDGCGGDNWSYVPCKFPVKMSPATDQHPTLYRLDALSVAEPTVTKHWREKVITFRGAAYTELIWGLPTFL